MKLQLDAKDEAFREEVREFLAKNLPPELVRSTRTATHPTRDEMLEWTRILAKKGWSVPHWPKEYGGTGWSALQLHLFEEECLMAGAPIYNLQAITLVGPVIYTFGSEAQKQKFLPPIVKGEVYWAQGFSEPNSGSDLASLRTRAVRDGDDYIVNGQKIWTTNAFMSDWIFCLVRTNTEVKAQAGISFLLVPSKAPGVTIRPILSLDEGYSLAEVFLDNVRVPAANLVGEEGKGWTYAKFLLANERTFSAEVPRNKRDIAMLKDIAKRERIGDRSLLEHPSFANRIAQAEIDTLALEGSVLRELSRGHDHSSPLPIPNVLKIRGTELMQTNSELLVEALGPYGTVLYPQQHAKTSDNDPKLPGPSWAPDMTSTFFYRRAATIYGGSNEIQRNIIGKTIFSMPEHTTASELSDDRKLLKESIDRFTERDYTFDTRRKALAKGLESMRASWKTFAEMGWLGAGLPEDVDGLGGSAEDTALVLESFGRALVVEPYLGTAVFAAQLIDKGASQAQRKDMLPGLIAGETIYAVAHDEPPARGQVSWVSTRAEHRGKGYVLNGKKTLVQGGPLAHAYIVSARTSGANADTDGISLFLVPRETAGLVCQDCRTIDNHQASDIIFEGVAVGEEALLGTLGGAYPALVHATEHVIVGALAEALGLMEKAFWTTVDYLKTRRQFGSALAEFQALQHRIADMLVRIELSRSTLVRAVEAVTDGGALARQKAVAAAKVYIGQAALYVGGQAIQLHGGVGVTDELAVGHYFKRLVVIEKLFGNADHHLNEYARLMKA